VCACACVRWQGIQITKEQSWSSNMASGIKMEVDTVNALEEITRNSRQNVQKLLRT